MVSLTGKSIPLAKKRRLVALIGCEALDTNGRILIPSEIRGRPSETAKFVEIFHEAKSAGPPKSFDQCKIVVVAESYKVYKSFPPSSLTTHAPFKSSLFDDILYISGMKTRIRPTQVGLYELLPSNVDAVIDDAGIHEMREGSLDLTRSFAAWEQLTRSHVLSAQRQVTVGMALKNSTTIIVDLNGVLVNDEPGHYSAFESLVRSLGGSLTYREYLLQCSGLSDEEGIGNLIKSKSLSRSPGELLKLKRKTYHALTEHNPPPTFPGAIELVRQLAQQGKSCFLVTSAPQVEGESFIVSCSLEEVFHPKCRFFNVRLADRQELYHNIAAGAGGNSSKIVLLDDSPSNVLTAHKLGITAVGLTTKHSPQEFEGTFVVASMSELFAEYLAANPSGPSGIRNR